MLLHFAGTLFITVIVEDSSVMGMTEQLSAITTNEGDMDTGGGASGVGGGGASLLGSQQGAGAGTAGNRTLNPFGGSPSSLGGGSSSSPGPSPGQFNQSNAMILPNLTLNPGLTSSSNTIPTGVDLSSRQLLLGNREPDTSITDQIQPDIISIQGDNMSGSNSTQQQQHGNETGQQVGTGTGPHSLENMMSSDDSGTGDIYPS